MTDANALRNFARNTAAANIFQHMATEEGADKLAAQLRALPESGIDAMARIGGVPEDQIPMYRALVRGEDNAFVQELATVDGLLQAGDVLLMTGKSISSKALAYAQKPTAIFDRVPSSHVALVLADFVCIDAMPKLGASNRIISEVLCDVEDGWRVLRCKKLQPEHIDTFVRACVFYLAQPYKVRPSKKSAKKHSYCSELARKVYSLSNITGVGIPDGLIIKPAHFDALADGHPQWTDVTETVRPAVDFCKKYPELVKMASALLIDGLKLNRQRFEDRAAQLVHVRRLATMGKISREEAMRMTKEIKQIENSLHHTFWDVPRRAWQQPQQGG